MKSLATLTLGILLSICLYHENNVFAQDARPGTAKLPGAPSQVWDVLFNFQANKQIWGVECDGSFLYASFPFDSLFTFGRYDYSGNLIEQFNIPGVPLNSLRDLCNDGNYFYAISNSSPSKIYKVDLMSKTLIGTITLPFQNGYHLSFDPALAAGNGGFWCGGYASLYSVNMSGAILSGPIIMPSGRYGSATDYYSSPGNKFLWFTSTSPPYNLSQFNIQTQTFTGVTHSTSDLGSTGPSMSYGLSDSKLYMTGKNVLLGSTYANTNPIGLNYRFFGYELGNTVQYPLDVGVVAILAPVSGPNLDATETVSITIQNFGTSNAYNIPVRFSINGLNSPTEIIPGPMAPGSQMTYIFTATANLSFYNSYQIVATTLSGDSNPSNDSKWATVVHSFPVVIDTIFPLAAPKWTGTVSGPLATPPNTIVQNSLINYSSGDILAAWAKFPLYNLPYGALISDVELHWFLDNQWGNPSISLRRLMADPLTTAPVNLFTAIKNGYVYTPPSASYNQAGSWHHSHLQDINNQVLSDIQSAAMSSQWWAVGFYASQSCSGCYYGSVHGWNQTGVPYLLVSRTVAVPHDVGVDAILLDPILLAGGTIYPAAKARNYGTTTETFSVTMTGPGGYTSTRNATRYPGQDTVLIFDGATFPPGYACFTATASLNTDLNLLNQTKGKCILIDSVLTLAYGFINDPLGSGLQTGPVRFFLEHPELLNQLSPTFSQPPITSGTLGKLGSADTWFVAETLNPPAFPNGNLVKTDLMTGVMTPIGPMGVSIDGMTYNYSFGKLFGISSIPSGCCNYQTTLYEINTSTGQATLYANLGLTSGKIDNLACNAAGMMFFTDPKSDQFYALDILTFSKEKLGPLGTDLNYATDMEFDRQNKQLYMAGNDPGNGDGRLYKVDAASGQTSLVNSFQGGVSLSGLAIPYTPPVSGTDAGIMWITGPVTGNMGTNEFVCVRLKNYGSSTINNFNISYQIGNGPVQTQPWGAIPLGTGDWIDYCFPNPETFAAGTTYCIKAWTSLPLDNNSLNDTAKKCITNTACTLASLCFPNALPETETCGDYLNDGCSMSTPAFENLNPGAAWCGDVWKVDTLIDQDWYQFTITAASNVYFAARTEFDLDMHLVSLPCSSSTVLLSHTAGKCGEDTLVYENLPSGTYALVLSPNLSNPDLLCGISNRYSLKFTAVPTQATITTFIGTVNEPCPGVHAVPIFIDSCYLVQQFHLNISLPGGVMLTGFNNLNPAFDPAFFTATQIGNQIILNWFSLTQVSPGSGLLINLMLAFPSGTTNLIWTTGPDSSYYANGSQGLLPGVFTGAAMNFGICNNLSGTVLYAHKTPAGIYSPYPVGNPAGPPYPVKVVLKQGNTILYTAYPDVNGQYSMLNLASGSYTLTAVVDLGWTGVNMIDAQLIMQNYVNSSTVQLTSPWLEAGDINGMGSPAPPNSLDALLIARRFVGIIPNFLPPAVVPGKPDWYSESFNIIINGTANQTKDIRVLCTGDVNGSN